jgi:autotransporter-associated beta strand protein
MNLGDILVSQGTLAFAESLDLGNPSASLTVSPGAKLQFYDLGLTNPIYRTINMTDATLTASGTSADTNVLNGSMQVAGAIGFFADQARLIVNGAIGGEGSITFGANDPGTLILNGINTYTGDTTVTNGTLGGNGVIAGNLLMLGGTNSPGWDGIGTLTVNGNATLGGTTRMELSRGLSPNSDRLVVGGTLAFGGTLQLVLLATPQPGDVYQVFNKGSSGVFTTLILPSLSGYPGAMSWDMSNLLLNGSIKVNGTLAPPTIGSATLSGGNFTFSGTGGVQGNTYSVVTSPNVAAPLASWTPVASNVFGSGGSFTFTTNIVGGAPAAFFRLRVP